MTHRHHSSCTDRLQSECHPKVDLTSQSGASLPPKGIYIQSTAHPSSPDPFSGVNPPPGNYQCPIPKQGP